MNSKGITLIEVMVSVMMISIGALGIAKATAGMTRMLTNGDRAAGAAIEAQARMERIRSTSCDSLSSGSDAAPSGYTLNWTVSGSGTTRVVQLVTLYTSGGGAVKADSFVTTVACL